MPLYYMHLQHASFERQVQFSKNLAALHAKTFGTNPAYVRVEFVFTPEFNKRYGGVGFTPKKGIFSIDRSTDFIVAHLDYKGTQEEWQDYCRKIVRLWGPEIRSVYLQRLEMEFEVDQADVPGKIVVNPDPKKFQGY